MEFLTTTQAAERLGVPLSRLRNALLHRYFSPLPRKDASGRFLWFEEDLQRAREGFARLRRGRSKNHAEQTPVAMGA